ncbi:Hypothetical protein PHPALM_3577 [Phytophthora palmivora]|uniref:Uncharacterized protein n=1 Tax=Phytophthora palmivora TaxID=4796 RepID=A0A2P4YM08_9STRA|nr:Hypothetical protein PHPALM_3577 [Phytophthora palmivora]
METLQSVVKLPPAKDMESPLLAVVVRVTERREQWLVEQGVSVESGKVLVEKGVQATLEYLEEQQVTSVTDGRAAFNYAARYGHAEVISLLLQRGADVAATEEDGWTALHYAAANGKTAVVSLLLQHGADVAATKEDGWTALHYAAANGKTEVVSLLLQHGADVAASDNVRSPKPNVHERTV